MDSVANRLERIEREKTEVQQEAEEQLLKIPRFQQVIAERRSVSRVELYPEGAIEDGDPRLFRRCRPTSQQNVNSARVWQCIADLKSRLAVLPYIALAAPQFGQSIRLLVMHHDGSQEGIEPIPYQAWLNPKIEVAHDAHLVPGWETYATCPERWFLVAAYSRIFVSGWCANAGMAKLEYVEHEELSEWRARAVQALRCYFDGYLPRERLLHPTMMINRWILDRYWKGFAVFFVRCEPSTKSLDVHAPMNVYEMIRAVAERHLCSEEGQRSIEVAGCIPKELPDLALASSALSEAFSELTNKRKRFVERQLHDSTVVRLFSLEKDPESFIVGTRRQLRVGGSSGSMEAHELFLPLSREDAMNTEQPVSDESEGEIPAIILAGYRAFERELPQLLRGHHGEWVAYHGENLFAFGDSAEDLLDRARREGYAEDELVYLKVEENPPLAFVEW